MTHTAGPVLQASDDERLANNVRNFVASRIPAATKQVRVDAEQGTVTLRGCVRSFYQKQLWLSGSTKVAGVRRVIDEIDVEPA
jgi:osmotically-inducible protein OsmY